MDHIVRRKEKEDCYDVAKVIVLHGMKLIED